VGLALHHSVLACVFPSVRRAAQQKHECAQSSIFLCARVPLSANAVTHFGGRGVYWTDGPSTSFCANSSTLMECAFAAVSTVLDTVHPFPPSAVCCSARCRCGHTPCHVCPSALAMSMPSYLAWRTRQLVPIWQPLIGALVPAHVHRPMHLLAGADTDSFSLSTHPPGNT
jgi:hypothetical protein